MAINAGDLRCRVELLERKKGANDLGETTYSYGSYDPPRKLWAKIVPTSGRRDTLAGDMDQAVVTHKMTIRRTSLPILSPDTRILYRGQYYDVQYGYPIYNRDGWMEVFLRLVVEDGIRSF